MHGTVIVVDVVGFGDLRRTNTDQLTVRRSLYKLLSQAFTDAGIDWDDCHREDRGDGVLVVAQPTVPKSPLVVELPRILQNLLHDHNGSHAPTEQIRLRMALHAGEIHHDEHGVAGRAVNLAFRLVDAPAFRQVCTQTEAALALITSAWFYEEVVWHVAATGYRQIAIEAKEIATTAWYCLPGSDSHAAPAAPIAAVRQLPTNTRQFAGRQTEVDRLTRLLDDATTDTVIITAIDGSAGIGKTTLALHWAHQVKDRFPDGQLHVNLRGFDPGEPMDAGQALHGFLQSLGVVAQSIPAELDAKAALYRSRLAGKRMLIMLDNARSAEHVRPLLPGTASCVTIITSRNRLDGLAVREGAVRIALDVMSSEEATALLEKRVGEVRLSREPQAVAEIIEMCAHLPLALSIVAARAADFSDVPLRTLVHELREERGRLDALDRGERDLSVRTVFSWSHKVVSPAAARMFRLLGVHPGPDIDVEAGDALAGEPSRALLNELTRAHMLAEYVPGRYRFHDLLRAYAVELGRGHPEWTVVARRMLDHYLDLALAANIVIQPCRDGVVRTPGPDLTYLAAMGRFASENMVLLAAVRFAAGAGFISHAWRLAWACATYLRRAGRHVERMAVYELVVAAARTSSDCLGLAVALRGLGRAYSRLDRHTEALNVHGEAVALFEQIGDEHGAVVAKLAYASVLGRIGRHGESLALIERLQQAMGRLGNDLLEADLLRNRSAQLLALRRYTEARAGYRRSLELYARLANNEGEAATLLDLAKVELKLGCFAEAHMYCRRALPIERQLGDLYYEALALERMGDVYAAEGDHAGAAAQLGQAAAVLERIHNREAGRVRAKVEALDTRSG